MPGLLNPTGGKPEAAPAQPDPTVLADDEGLGEEATPEEQAAYEEFVLEGYALLYEGGKVRPAILKMLDEDPADLMEVLEDVEELKSFNHVVALAATAVVVMLQVVRKWRDNKGAVPDAAILLHGGTAILEDLVEVAEKAGIRSYTEEEMIDATRMGADIFREAAAAEGLVDLEAAKAGWDELVAADREGRLAEVSPELAAFGQAVEAHQAQQAQPEAGNG